MFELSIARKYLIPKKKQLSVTLIALMSVGVISLVVWLILVFLSVTEGMEKNWLKKLTDLNAPIKITPTPHYHSSYYYQVDSISEASSYQQKTIGEKLNAIQTDPYNPQEDREVPYLWPSPDLDSAGRLKDPVKTAFSILEQIKKEYDQNLAFQDYEMSGALLKLQLLRPKSSSPTNQSAGESINFLSQVTYIVSLPDQSRALRSLLIPPSQKDINNLLYLSGHRLEGERTEGSPYAVKEDIASFQSKISSLLQNINISSLKTVSDHWKIPYSLLPHKFALYAYAYLKDGCVSYLILKSKAGHQVEDSLVIGELIKNGENLEFVTKEKNYTIDKHTPLLSSSQIEFKSSFDPKSLLEARHLGELTFTVESNLNGILLQGSVPFGDLEIQDFHVTTQFEKEPAISPSWSYFQKTGPHSYRGVLPSYENNQQGILLPKSFQDLGVLIGDKGFLSYMASTTGSMQEQRLPIFVSGFYDPGILSVGAKCLLVPKSITRAINSANISYAFDKISTNGIQVWVEDLSQTETLKNKIEQAFAKEGIAQYWNVTSFKEYDFAKDLMQQFQSDKYLFSLVGIIIITVACCNIISLLVLLVNDKKKEIGILQAMGASSKSIAMIFGICGMALGLVGGLIGLFAALLTLHNIDSLVQLLSFLQGHEAFNAAFYGKALPNELSTNAAWFVIIVTPLLALIAGLIPALKACLLKPSDTLRS